MHPWKQSISSGCWHVRHDRAWKQLGQDEAKRAAHSGFAFLHLACLWCFGCMLCTLHSMPMEPD